MGQQQLLLLVLGVVVVGLGVVGGVEAFNQGLLSSKKDQINHQIMRVGSEMRTWRMKPVEMGGGGGEWPNDLSEVFPDNPNVSFRSYTLPGGDVLKYRPNSGPDNKVKIFVQERGSVTAANGYYVVDFYDDGRTKLRDYSSRHVETP